MKIDFLKIKSGCLLPKGNTQGFKSYVLSIEQLVKKMIPKDLFLSEVTPPHFLSYTSYFQKLSESLPIITWSPLEEAPCSVSIAILCLAQLTHGIGRFFCDTIARNLIPGKPIPITVIRSLNFRFIIYPKENYFITEIHIDIKNEQDLNRIKKSLPRVTEELRLTLLATQHARKLVLTKPLSMDEKRMILLENLSSFVKPPEGNLDYNILEEAHHFLLKIVHHEKPSQIPDHLLPFIKEKPKALDNNMFQSMQSLILMFDESIISKRALPHLYRTLSYLYLFHKVITHRLKIKSNEHLISSKILRTTTQSKTPILAILICMNFVKEHEELDYQELIEMIQTYLPYSHLIKNSFVHSKDKDRVCMIYLEMQRKDQLPFPHNKVKELKKKLPKKMRSLIHSSQIDHIYDTNEEEVIRNILTLIKELKTVHTQSPIIIHFVNETEFIVTFRAILVCLRHQNVQFENTSYLKVLSHQTKIAGILNNRHIKKAHILVLQFDKTSFLQEHTSFSFYKARKSILHYLKKYFGPMRDFNSGMIVKQYENLSKLKAAFPSNPFIEKYFYSITPGYMQNLLSIELLTLLYKMVFKSLRASFDEKFYHLDSKMTKTEFLLTISSPSDDFIYKIKQAIPSLTPSLSNLTISDVSVDGTRGLGIIFFIEAPFLKHKFLTKITSLIKSLDPCFPSII